MLEIWFGYGSTYTFLTASRLRALAASRGVEVAWRPFNLTALFGNKGIVGGPFAGRVEKIAYMWRDLERRAARHGLPYRKPAVYPVDSQKTARVGYLAQEEGWCDLFTERVFELNFVHGKPIGAAGSLEEAISHVGKDPTEVFARAFTDRVEAGLQSQTERAEQLGMFGSPNFLVGDEMFWGDDRLEDAIDCALGG